MASPTCAPVLWMRSDRHGQFEPESDPQGETSAENAT